MVQVEQATVQAKDEKLREHEAAMILQQEHAVVVEDTDTDCTEHFVGKQASEVVHTFRDGAYSTVDAIGECIHGMEEDGSRLVEAFVTDIDIDSQSVFLE